MNSRSKKYHDDRKAGNADKAKSSEGKALLKPNAPESLNESKKEPENKADNAPATENYASQDDTGGGNETGKRIDEN